MQMQPSFMNVSACSTPPVLKLTRRGWLGYASKVIVKRDIDCMFKQCRKCHMHAGMAPFTAARPLYLLSSQFIVTHYDLLAGMDFTPKGNHIEVENDDNHHNRPSPQFNQTVPSLMILHSSLQRLANEPRVNELIKKKNIYVWGDTWHQQLETVPNAQQTGKRVRGLNQPIQTFGKDAWSAPQEGQPVGSKGESSFDNQKLLISNKLTPGGGYLVASSNEQAVQLDHDRIKQFLTWLQTHFKTNHNNLKAPNLVVLSAANIMAVLEAIGDKEGLEKVPMFEEELTELLKNNRMEQESPGGQVIPSSLSANRFKSSTLEPSPIKANLSPHLPILTCQAMVLEGTILEGRYLRDRSWVRVAGQRVKVKMFHNRAVYGDTVYVRVVNHEMLSAHPKKDKKQEKAQGLNNQSKWDEAIEDPISAAKLLANKSPLTASSITSTTVTQVCGIKTHTLRKFTGTIDPKLCYLTTTNYRIYLVCPTDPNFPPCFMLRVFQLNNLLNKRLQLAYDSWPECSSYPLCHLLRVVGAVGDQKAEADVILLEHNVKMDDFTKQAYACLPKDVWQVNGDQECDGQKRTDLRHLDVVSVDPPGCKDIDDALHCQQVKWADSHKKHYEVGVHIADVSHYVRPDTALDMEARDRCTTVYLVDRRTDMLPKLLTENLCSLKAKVDRLAFSVIWVMDEDGNIKGTKFMKTAIKSRHAFTYKEAQALIDGKTPDSQVSTKQELQKLRKPLIDLLKISKALKGKRLEKGALQLASTQVKVTLSEQTHSATDVSLYDLVDTNHMIEEFMLLANVAVAEKIYTHYPSLSILRRHSQPKPDQLAELKSLLSPHGFQLDSSSSLCLSQSLDSISRPSDPYFNTLIRMLVTRCMNEATYFCSADYDPAQFYHYGLATEFYTHFTSPIRRYADVLVHRLLASSIDLEALPNFMTNKQKLSQICTNLNFRNRMARFASRSSGDYHTCQYFGKGKKQNNQSSIELEKAIIVGIEEDYIRVMLVNYGLEGRIPLGTKSRVKEHKPTNSNSQGGIQQQSSSSEQQQPQQSSTASPNLLTNREQSHRGDLWVEPNNAKGQSKQPYWHTIKMFQYLQVQVQARMKGFRKQVDMIVRNVL